MKSSFRFILILIFCLAISSVDIAAQNKSAETEVVKPVKKANQRPVVEPSKSEPFDKATVEMMAKQCVKFETEAGNIEMEMFPESAPESVRSFLNLTATGAFDTTTFSRVVPGFIVQGGDLYTRQQKMTVELGNRARKTLPDEPSQIKHERGILSMARSDEPNTATTNFFILVGNAPHLDGTFAAFGRVIKGMEVVDEINKTPAENEKPKNSVRITKATAAPCPVQGKTLSVN
ncbi:hypothetical protein BH20ACI1_BH20ACI1_08600 [soil metagenome]